jgi:hypothetical protein
MGRLLLMVFVYGVAMGIVIGSSLRDLGRDWPISAVLVTLSVMCFISAFRRRTI